MDMLKTEKIHRLVLPTPFPVGDVNIYLVEGEALTLVDTGAKTEEAWEAFKLQLKELGRVPDDIEQVILTHHHPDHAGLLDYLPESIPVIGHWKNDPWISRDETFFRNYEEFLLDLFQKSGIDSYFLKFVSKMNRSMKYSCSRKLTGTIAEGDEAPGLPGWSVYEVPGHAGSHIMLHNRETGIAIGGDVLLQHISSNPLIEPPYPGEEERARPQLLYNESLKKVAALHPEIVLPGHGRSVEKAAALVENRLKKQHERALTIHGWLNEQPMTAFQICKKLFPTIFQKELGLTMSETIGQLDYLEDEGLIYVDRTCAAWCYYAAD
ncbi:MBL fold metallo-hydrolase [Bacillus marinisedimentorum]|uniref:MBL fold metallo-hydrolase n=1 Tax=Bacillus marinisedimentorum TaxID=1821260 RepID=UPI001FDEAA3E|nr:MBL fold metallo-hydrolase [Bacillus marinisedimentorum]